MASHFKLKAIIDGTTVVDEHLDNLTGSKTIKAYPMDVNDGTNSIRSTAIINLMDKVYNIPFTHKGKSQEDPESSSVKWSYFYPLYNSADSRVSDNISKSQEMAYLGFSCGNTVIDENSTAKGKLIVSLPYNTLAGLEETVGDFTGTHYGRVFNYDIQNPLLIDLIAFKMYYRNIGTDGVIPVDDDTPENNKARIPGRPEVSAVPDWITDTILKYDVWAYTTLDHSQAEYHSFSNWEDFIQYWDNTVVGDSTIVDASFSYRLWGKVQFNNLPAQRSGTITFSEIWDGKGSGKHGIKPLYLKLTQQESFTKYHLSSIPAPVSTFVDEGDTVRWTLLDSSNQSPLVGITDIAKNALPEAQDETYGNHCIYTPEFKVRSSIDTGRGIPASVWAEKGYSIFKAQSSRPDLHKDDFSGISHQYIGKPIVLGAFKETPSILEPMLLKPYKLFQYTVRSSISGSHGGSQDDFSTDTIIEEGIDYASLLGYQSFDPFTFNVDNPNELAFKDDIEGEGIHKIHKDTALSWRLLSGVINNNKHWIFKLIPVSILGSANNLELSYSGKGVNEVVYFNQYNSAVTSEDLVNRATYAEYHNRTSPELNSTGTMNGRQFEVDYIIAEEPEVEAYWKKVYQVMFIPVLYTDFYLEQENPFQNLPSGVLGRLYFSIINSSSDEDVSDLNQLVIKVPTITRD